LRVLRTCLRHWIKNTPMAVEAAMEFAETN
jgi:hypothetical protein